MSKMVSIDFDFFGTLLPVVVGVDGFQRVPMKPLCQAIGIDWESQREKVRSSQFVRRMRINKEKLVWFGQKREMVMISIDRVDAYLNTLNPDPIRAGGNVEAADWLEAKHAEWDEKIFSKNTRKRLVSL